jgi:nitronate monooxygenase
VADSRLGALLSIEHPLLQAGMGGVAGPDLAAAVSNAGCGGTLGLYKLDGPTAAELVQATAALTRRSFGVNFVPEVVSPGHLATQVEAALEASPPTTFFTFFGPPPDEVLARIRAARRRTLVQLGTIAEADRAVAAGVDACIAQGIEAGGHHLGSSPTQELTAELHRRHPRVPLVASGGIESGGQLVELERSGADGCSCGTLFVAAAESNAHEDFKQRVVAAAAADTVVTETFAIGWPSRPHRVLRNRSVEERETLDSSFIATTTIAGRRYPIPRFSAAVPTSRTEGRVGEMALYCGTSCEGIDAIQPAAEIVEEFLATYA